jgi:glycosyltransferase involved in cell wall biosynthesis
LASEDWYFCSHRLFMACAARRAGFQVHVATRVGQCGPNIESLGFHLHPLNWRRGTLNPLRVARTILEIRRLYRKIRPDLAHHVAFESSVLGSLAATGLPMMRLNALTGLGFVFASRSSQARYLERTFRPLLRFLCNRRDSAVLVQSSDDSAYMTARGVTPEHLFVIKGSGVDVSALLPLPEPPPPITVAYAGRLLAYKGAQTLVAAHKLLAARGCPVRVLIAGQPDPANPDSISPDEIERWRQQEGIAVLGHVDDIRDVWTRAHISVLVSRHEGVPKALLEAAACGRPIIASDVPGCREIAQPGLNALLVPPDNAEALADAIHRLAQDSKLRRRFGEAGRKLVETAFSGELIGRQTVELYERLLARRAKSYHSTDLLIDQKPVAISDGPDLPRLSEQDAPSVAAMMNDGVDEVSKDRV